MNRHFAPDDCASLAPFLTELFDGEADADAAARARAHLLSCQQCARLWLDWNSHRNILRNDRVPVPPPTLLWRVLVACRVSAHNSAGKRRTKPALPALLHSLEIFEAPVPSDLSAHILARTTRAPASQTSAPTPARPLARPRSKPLARRADSALWAPVALSPAPQSSGPGRAARFRALSLLGAPALAALLLLLGRANFDVRPAPTSALRRDFSASGAAPQRPGASAQTVAARAPQFASATLVEAPEPAELPAQRFGQRRTARPVMARVEAGAERARFEVSPRATGASSAPQLQSVAWSEASVRTDEGLNQMFVAAFDAARQNDVAPRAAPPIASPARAAKRRAVTASRALEPRQSAPLVPENAARPRSAPVKMAALGARAMPMVAVRARTASFSEQPNAPRSRVALSQVSVARNAPDDDSQTLRVSRPLPSSPAVRLASLSEGSGPRIDELRSAVDDFRAAISDNTGEGWDG